MYNNDYVLSIGGYVFGVILDEDEWKAKHRCIDNYFLLQEARNSKYIQSDTGSTYSLAKQLLNKDKTVVLLILISVTIRVILISKYMEVVRLFIVAMPIVEMVLIIPLENPAILVNLEIPIVLEI